MIFALALAGMQLAPAPAQPSRLTELTDRVFDLTNHERSVEGHPILAKNLILANAATTLAKDLASRGVLEHFDRQGRTVSERYELAGYVRWTCVAENIAFGQRSAEEVVNGWMASKGHRANILDGDVRELGVGVALDRKGRIFWVQSFGSRQLDKLNKSAMRSSLGNALANLRKTPSSTLRHG